MMKERIYTLDVLDDGDGLAERQPGMGIHLTILTTLIALFAGWILFQHQVGKRLSPGDTSRATRDTKP